MSLSSFRRFLGEVDWVTLSFNSFVWGVLFLLLLALSPGILSFFYIPVTLANRWVSSAIITLFGLYIVPKLFGLTLGRYDIENNLRLYFRKNTTLRGKVLIRGLVVLFATLLVALCLTILLGYTTVFVIILIFTAVLYSNYFLLLTLFPYLLIGVEGKNDINFLKNISKVLLEYGENVPDLVTLEENGDIIFIPIGGSDLELWQERFKVFSRREFYIFDRDADPLEPAEKQSKIDAYNELPRCKAIATGKREMENYIHPAAIKAARNIDIAFDGGDDVPCLAAKALHEASNSSKVWCDLKDTKAKEKISNAKKWLNQEAVLQMTPQLLDEIDPDGDVRGWLKEIAQILEN
ncbi:MAG: hypothetical protein KDI62_25025 [Anaerolineae bacterium]|nr:hypothetical protein [Anaerolineae bacterium]